MILVVGGAGYIGSHMVKMLRDEKIAHLVFDNLELGHRDAVAGSPLIVGDLRSRDTIAEVFRTHPEIDVVMHFAAYTLVGESVTNPGKYWENNTTAVMYLLDAMRDAGVKKFVFSSTCATFGEPEYIPLDEDHPQNPVNPYGQTKLAVEKMLDDYDRAYGLRNVALRYFNAAGAALDGSIGEDHRPEAHLIPNAIYAAVGKGARLKLFGTDYDTPDGTCVRDYIHVLDLAQAHLLAVKHLRAGGASKKYNLGNGQGYSVREVIDMVSSVLAMDVPFDESPRRAGDAAKLIGTSQRIIEDWGWKPQYPELKTIVESAWSWHKSHPNGYAEN